MGSPEGAACALVASYAFPPGSMVISALGANAAKAAGQVGWSVYFFCKLKLIHLFKIIFKFVARFPRRKAAICRLRPGCTDTSPLHPRRRTPRTRHYHSLSLRQVGFTRSSSWSRKEYSGPGLQFCKLFPNSLPDLKLQLKLLPVFCSAAFFPLLMISKIVSHFYSEVSGRINPCFRCCCCCCRRKWTSGSLSAPRAASRLPAATTSTNSTLRCSCGLFFVEIICLWRISWPWLLCTVPW